MRTTTHFGNIFNREENLHNGSFIIFTMNALIFKSCLWYWSLLSILRLYMHMHILYCLHIGTFLPCRLWTHSLNPPKASCFCAGWRMRNENLKRVKNPTWFFVKLCLGLLVPILWSADSSNGKWCNVISSPTNASPNEKSRMFRPLDNACIGLSVP